MNFRRRQIWHITQHFWPPVGGQEQLILKMCNLAASLGYISIIIQPLNISFFKRSSYINYKIPTRTFLVPLPTYSLLISIINKIISILDINLSQIGNNSNILSIKAFNTSLKLFSYFINQPNFNKITFIHYHYHQPFFRVKKTIIFSHGVEWQRPPVSSIDVYKSNFLKNVISDKFVSHIIANDKDYIAECKKLGIHGHEHKLFYLPNPVDVNNFNGIFLKAEDQLANRKIVMIRNIRPDRGILEGILSFIDFVSNSKYTSWELHIYGNYSAHDAYFKKCQIASGFAFNKCIFFHGPINHNLVSSIFKQSSISLVPSQSLEGTSLSALESMSAGVPCVSTSVGGLSDLPTFKSKSLSHLDIAISIASLLDDYEEIRKYQMLKTQEYFSLNKWENSLIKFFSSP
jgi:glycosyltransferase involved in cell wall biosynthesis